MKPSLLAAAILALAPFTPAAAQEKPAPAPDYANPASWLCRPGMANSPCDADLSATALPAFATEPSPAAATNAPVDCFYVYPTVSSQKRSNADATLTEDERYVATQQLARFRSACRLFAPLYRQTTLTQLRGQAPAGDGDLAYADVKRAWETYLRENPKRGVILIGHSQGSRHLKKLIAEEIAGKPVASRVVAAYLPGFNVAVPRGRPAGGRSDGTGQAAGGDLGSFALCATPGQTGCAVAYVSFLSDSPPPANARFGRVADANSRAACVNPASLAGDGTLVAYLPSRPRPGITSAPAPAMNFDTPYLRLDGLIKGGCVEADGASYFAVSTEVPQLKPLLAAASADPAWGLHIVDVNLALGNLVALAKAQGTAWAARN